MKNKNRKTFWNNKKIFITGHTGFKGAWMSLILTELGAKVIGYSLKPTKKTNLFLDSDLKNREALIITFWKSYDDHENSHKSDSFQPLFQKVIDLCENGNEEIVYDMLWQGEAYTPEMAKMAQSAKEENS